MFAAASATAGPSSLALLPVSASPMQTPPRAQPLAVVPKAASIADGSADVQGHVVCGGKRPAQTRRDLVLVLDVPRPSPYHHLVPRPHCIGGPQSQARHRAGAPLTFLPLLANDEGQRAVIIALAATATGLACYVNVWRKIKALSS